MRYSNKSRTRNKSRNTGRSNPGNVINRVFDSSGPEGKVRGTPQQIIDKYHSLARDAQLAGDRVAHENFLQHTEHYVRLLGEAQREMEQRREQHESQRQNQQHNHSNQSNQGTVEPYPKPVIEQVAVDASGEQPSIPDSPDLYAGQNDSNLVLTPESQPATEVGKIPARKRQAKSAAPSNPVAPVKREKTIVDDAPEAGTNSAE